MFVFNGKAGRFIRKCQSFPFELLAFTHYQSSEAKKRARESKHSCFSLLHSILFGCEKPTSLRAHSFFSRDSLAEKESPCSSAFINFLDRLMQILVYVISSVRKNVTKEVPSLASETEQPTRALKERERMRIKRKLEKMVDEKKAT